MIMTRVIITSMCMGTIVGGHKRVWAQSFGLQYKLISKIIYGNIFL